MIEDLNRKTGTTGRCKHSVQKAIVLPNGRRNWTLSAGAEGRGKKGKKGEEGEVKPLHFEKNSSPMGCKREKVEPLSFRRNSLSLCGEREKRERSIDSVSVGKSGTRRGPFVEVRRNHVREKVNHVLLPYSESCVAGSVELRERTD